MFKIACDLVSAFVVAAMTAVAIIVPVEKLVPYKIWVIIALSFVLIALIIRAVLQFLDDRRERIERKQLAAQIQDMHHLLFANAPVAFLQTEPQGTIYNDDPRLYPEFLDERGSNHLYKKTAIILQNRGGADAHNVSIETIPLRGNSITFPTNVGVIPPQGKATFEPRMEGRWGLFSQNFIRVLVDEWNTYNDASKKTLELSMKVVYQNFTGTAIFETRCTLILDPSVEALPKTYGAPHHGRPAIRFGNPEFRKVAIKQPAHQP
jgi:hypothetical protein